VGRVTTEEEMGGEKVGVVGVVGTEPVGDRGWLTRSCNILDTVTYSISVILIRNQKFHFLEPFPPSNYRIPYYTKKLPHLIVKNIIHKMDSIILNFGTHFRFLKGQCHGIVSEMSPWSSSLGLN
jgi:hypothetical protein